MGGVVDREKATVEATGSSIVDREKATVEAPPTVDREKATVEGTH